MDKKFKEPKLTAKQKAFADHYLICLNKTEAARRAGYRGDKWINRTAISVYNHPLVQEYLKERMEKIEKERVATGDEVLTFLTSTMRGEIKDQFGLDASLSDRLKASELLGKRHKLFTDKIQKEGKQNIEINIKKVSDK